MEEEDNQQVEQIAQRQPGEANPPVNIQEKQIYVTLKEMTTRLKSGIADEEAEDILRRFFVLPKNIHRSDFLNIASCCYYYGGSQDAAMSPYWLPLRNKWTEVCKALGIDETTYESKLEEYLNGTILKEGMEGQKLSSANDKSVSASLMYESLPEERKKVVKMKYALLKHKVDVQDMTSDKIVSHFNPESKNYKQEYIITFYSAAMSDILQFYNSEAVARKNSEDTVEEELNIGKVFINS